MLASHQPPLRACKTSLWLPQLRRSGEREPDVRALFGHRAVKEREVSVDAPGQECSILVVGLHDESVPLEAFEVVGEREGHAGPTLAERRVGDGVLAQLVHEGDARILDAPQLFGIVLWIGTERRLSVDNPAVDPVRRASRTKVRQAAPIFDATQKQGRAVAQAARARVENAMDWIRPVGRRQDGVLIVPVKECFVDALHRHALTLLRATSGCNRDCGAPLRWVPARAPDRDRAARLRALLAGQKAWRG